MHFPRTNSMTHQQQQHEILQKKILSIPLTRHYCYCFYSGVLYVLHQCLLSFFYFQYFLLFHLRHFLHIKVDFLFLTASYNKKLLEFFEFFFHLSISFFTYKIRPKKRGKEIFAAALPTRSIE